MTHAHWGQHLYYHQKNTLSLLKPKRGNAGERCLRQREVYLPQGVPLGQRSGGRLNKCEPMCSPKYMTNEILHYVQDDRYCNTGLGMRNPQYGRYGKNAKLLRSTFQFAMLMLCMVSLAASYFSRAFFGGSQARCPSIYNIAEQRFAIFFTALSSASLVARRHTLVALS